MGWSNWSYHRKGGLVGAILILVLAQISNYLLPWIFYSIAQPTPFWDDLIRVLLYVPDLTMYGYFYEATGIYAGIILNFLYLVWGYFLGTIVGAIYGRFKGFQSFKDKSVENR